MSQGYGQLWDIDMNEVIDTATLAVNLMIISIILTAIIMSIINNRL